MIWKKCLCLISAAGMLLAAACTPQPATVAEETQSLTNPIVTEQSEQVSIQIEETAIATMPIHESTTTPTPEVTEESTPIPVPTREPFSMEGDITANFPNYDTGVDADYSYQSDELRIAITKYVNPHDPDIPETYYVADVWMRNINCFRTGFGNGEFYHGTEDGEVFAIREHAILAVNGTYNTGLIIHNGTKFRGLSTTISHKGICILYEDGSMKTFSLKKDKLDIQKEEKKGIVQAWQFGPVLVQNGEVAGNFKVNATRHPRIIVGYYEPGHYCFVAVDGRSAKRAIGMNEYEMAQLMLELGCKEAMNLDGGTSALMTFMGECISHPSGVDKDGDGKAGRNLLDMLLVAEYDREGNAPALDEVDTSRLRYKTDA